MTTDGFAPYRSALTTTLHDRCGFAQLIQVYRAATEGEGRYSPAEVASTEVITVMGQPDPERICTSIVERQTVERYRGARARAGDGLSVGLLSDEYTIRRGWLDGAAHSHFQVTTDGFAPYRSALTTTLHDHCGFAQLIQVYRAATEGNGRNHRDGAARS